MSEVKNSVYEKLTPQRKQLVDKVLENLENGAGLWKQGWEGSGLPESAITGRKYHGVNSLFLMFVAMDRGYTDNRWLTYNQMKEKGWEFKKGEDGKTLGHGAGVNIEYFELRDRETKQPFDSQVLDGMDAEERAEYMSKNVYPLRKFFRVFNGDVIQGIPEKQVHQLDESGYSARAEGILKMWNDRESKILYGGNEAYYHRGTDRIHLPERGDFYDLQEFYATALHEIGHSTGHPKRLNRNMGDGFGTPSYAVEELRAEIASMFMEQELGIAAGEKHIQNNSAYIQSWKSHITENPDVLFEAIADADKITRYVMQKEQQKSVEPFAIEATVDEYGEPIYRLHMASEDGQTKQPLAVSFKSREELMEEVGKMQELPDYADKELKEVSLDELQKYTVQQATAAKKAERREEVKEEPSAEFIRPSELAARSVATGAAVGAAAAVSMAGRGVESLTRMSDRDVVERAMATKSGDKFTKLYNGASLLGSEEKNERSLLARIAMFVNGDEQQLLRIFKSSGQYRDEKPNAYYEKLAKQEIQFVARLKGGEAKAPSLASESGRGGHRAINANS